MRATNHALTGAIIGLTVQNPWVALPAAVVSHFVCDLIPHHDDPSIPMGSKTEVNLLILDAVGAVGVATFLFVLRPEAWFVACWAAFLATSPDLMWIPRFIKRVKTGHDIEPRNFIERFHARIQRLASPKGAVVELAWAFGALVVLAKLTTI
jgi:hypothetical protein